MAKTLEIPIYQDVSCTAKLFAIGSDTVVETIVLSEATNRKGLATGVIASATGWNRAIVFNGSTAIGDFVVNVGSADPATYQAVDDVAIDWAKIQNATSTVGLTGTTVKTATDVETRTQDLQARTPAALTAGGNMKSDALAINGSTSGAANLATMYAALHTGTAQAGGASSITLAGGAPSVSLVNQAVWIVGGTGAYQTNRISAYDTGTKVATVVTAWATQPDNTSVYVVLGRVE